MAETKYKVLKATLAFIFSHQKQGICPSVAPIQSWGTKTAHLQALHKKALLLLNLVFLAFLLLSHVSEDLPKAAAEAPNASVKTFAEAEVTRPLLKSELNCLECVCLPRDAVSKNQALSACCRFSCQATRAPKC